MLTDFRVVLRGLLRDRAFTFFIVVALALGLGINGSLLALSRAFFLRPSPVFNPETLVEVVDDTHDGSKEDRLGSTTAYAEVKELPEFQAVAIAPSHTFEMRWKTGEGFRPLLAAEASSEYLEVIGVRPFLGRGFLPSESGVPGGGKVVMVSHRFWKEALGGQVDVLGSALSLGGEQRTVVGVLPPGFEGHRQDLGLEVLVSSAATPPIEAQNRLMTGVLARLRPGVLLDQVRTRLRGLPWSSGFTLDAQPYRPLPPVFGGRLARGLGLLHGMGFLVLGIALCNVLSLQAARLHKRRPELALRAALGAEGGHLFRLLLLENLVLAVLAGWGALCLAGVSSTFLDAIQAVLPYPPKVRVTLGLWTAGATFGLSLTLGFLLALAGLLQVRRLELSRPLHGTGLRASGTRARSLFVAVQAALSLAVLSTAALSLRDLHRQLDIPLGFALKDRFQISCDPRGANRPWSDLERVMPALRERITALPGVKATALSVGGAPMVKGVTHRDLGGRVVFCTPELPELLGLKAIEGRNLEESDLDQGRVLMGASMVRTMHPDGPLLGVHTSPSGERYDVVGILPPLGLDGPTRRLTAVLFHPVSRVPMAWRFPFDTLTIHAPGSPKATLNALGTAVRDVLGGLPFEFHSLEALRDEKLAQPHRLLALSSIFGALALALSLCGLAAHLAQARKRELGIRVVLGAGPGRILAVLAKGSLLPVMPGLAAGAGLSLAVSRLLVSQTPGFEGLDGHLLLAASLALCLAAALTCLIPALRAARVQPAVALRSE